MQQPVIVIGMGNMGQAFARGLLSSGYPVYPVLRETDPADVAREVPDPALVLVAVREGDLPGVLSNLPAAWRDRVGLLQNELLPRDWQAHHLPEPTVAVVWFERRPNMPPTPYYPNPVYGPHAGILLDALEELDMPAVHITERDELLYELVRKNLYILARNIMGLAAEGTLGEVWNAHRSQFEAVAREILDVQAWLAGEPLPRERLLDQLARDIERLPDKATKGSSAPERLRRTLDQAEQAEQAGLDVPHLREIYADWQESQ